MSIKRCFGPDPNRCTFPPVVKPEPRIYCGGGPPGTHPPVSKTGPSTSDSASLTWPRGHLWGVG